MYLDKLDERRRSEAKTNDQVWAVIGLKALMHKISDVRRLKILILVFLKGLKRDEDDFLRTYMQENARKKSCGHPYWIWNRRVHM